MIHRHLKMFEDIIKLLGLPEGQKWVSLEDLKKVVEKLNVGKK